MSHTLPVGPLTVDDIIDTHARLTVASERDARQYAQYLLDADALVTSAARHGARWGDGTARVIGSDSIDAMKGTWRANFDILGVVRAWNTMCHGAHAALPVYNAFDDAANAAYLAYFHEAR